MASYENGFEEDIENLSRIFSLTNHVIKIKSIKCQPGSNSGDNYMSVVKRVLITGYDKNNQDLKMSIIVKRQIPCRSRRKLYRCDEAFDNEINAYKYIVPMLRDSSKSISYPKCYFAGEDDHGEIIILEDLKQIEFKMKNRLTGLDYDHCQLVMKELAKMHAASITVKTLNHDLFQKNSKRIKEIVYCPEAEEFYKGLLETSIREALISLRSSNFDGTLTHPIRLIEDLQPILFKKIQNYINTSLDQCNVICHGDLWVNNIMFKLNDNQIPKEVKFFDLQTMRYTSPVFDILHFIYTSTKRDLRDMYLKRILEVYGTSLHQCLELHLLPDNFNELQLLKETFSLENISNQFYSHILYGLAVCMWILPAVTFDPTNIPNLDQISEVNTSSSELKCTQKLTPEYHSRMRDIALEFYHNGFLNIS